MFAIKYKPSEDDDDTQVDDIFAIGNTSSDDPDPTGLPCLPSGSTDGRGTRRCLESEPKQPGGGGYGSPNSGSFAKRNPPPERVSLSRGGCAVPPQQASHWCRAKKVFASSQLLLCCARCCF